MLASPALSSLFLACSLAPRSLTYASVATISSSSSSPPPLDHRDLAFLLQGPVPPPHVLQIHARVFRLGAHQDNLLATRLIGRHNDSHLALRVLRVLRKPNAFPFNAAIRVLSDSGLVPSAFSVFKTLKRADVLPNDFSFSFLLKACVRCAGARQVGQVHAHVAKSGFDTDGPVCIGLLSAYAKGVGDVASARKVFDRMPEKGNACHWTCLIAGYAQSSLPEEALMLFLRMLAENVRPADDTMVSVLSACSRIREVDKWIDNFAGHSALGHESSRDSVDSVLIYLYGRLGKTDKSRDLFDKMIEKGEKRMGVVTWNSMISSYVQNGHFVDALDLFRQMLIIASSKPNHVTIVSILSACSQMGDLDLGRWARDYMKSKGRMGVLQSNTILATAFIDMFTKCGSLEEAKEVFHGISKKDTVIFNAMIMGLAVNGQGKEAIDVYNEMRRAGLHPSDGTFLGLLSACTHSGLVCEGRAFFTEMDQIFSVIPKLEHYACYVDLLARAGHVEEALEVVKNMPIEPSGQIWGALLGACLVQSKVDVAKYAAQRLVQVDPRSSSGYVMLSNAYAVGCQWGEIVDVRGMMRERGVRKQAGCSWINVDGVMHEFFVGCNSLPQMQRLYLTLDSLYKDMVFNNLELIHQ